MFFLWWFAQGFLTFSFLFCLSVLLLLAAGGSELLGQNSDVIILRHISKNFPGERDSVGVECVLHEELDKPMMG